MRIADQGELEGVGAPTSPQLPLCLADEAGAAHPVGGNLGHRGMSTKMCALNSANGAVQGPYIGDTIGPKPANRTNNLNDRAKRPDRFDRGLGSPHDMKA